MKIVTSDSRHQKGFYRALECDGVGVSWLNAFDYDMRIGAATVKMGGIAGVGTHALHRMKGYSRVVMDDTTCFLKEQGYDVAALFGIDHFYHKFGYACLMSEAVGRVRTRDAEAAGDGGEFRVRAAVDADHAKITRLYNEATAERTLALKRAVSRMAHIRHGSQWRRTPEVFVVESVGGRFAGYFIQDATPAPTTLCEVELVTSRAMSAVVGALARTAVVRRDGEITLVLPRDHAFMTFMRRYGCVMELTFRNTGGAMGRIVNQDTLLAKLAGACLESRGAESTESFGVEVVTELGRTRVAVPGSYAGRSRLTIPQSVLLQTVCGFRAPAEVLFSSGVKATGAAARLLDFLHCGGEPYMYAIDHF